MDGAPCAGNEHGWNPCSRYLNPHPFGLLSLLSMLDCLFIASGCRPSSFLRPFLVHVLAPTCGDGTGAYHFGHPNADAVAQAHHFVSTVGTLRKGDFVVLDIEAADKMSATAYACSLTMICFARVP